MARYTFDYTNCGANVTKRSETECLVAGLSSNSARSSLKVNSDKKYYFEITVNTGLGGLFGICDESIALNGDTSIYTLPGTAFVFAENGNSYIDGVSTAYMDAIALNETIGVVVDMTARQMIFIKGNVVYSAITIPSSIVTPYVCVTNGSSSTSCGFVFNDGTDVTSLSENKKMESRLHNDGVIFLNGDVIIPPTLTFKKTLSANVPATVDAGIQDVHFTEKGEIFTYTNEGKKLQLGGGGATAVYLSSREW